MPSAACGPCRERRLRCDQKVPRCSNCARGHRICPGYGRGLSWPRSNDKKRSIIGPESRTPVHVKTSRWANVGFQDIHIHNFMSGALIQVVSEDPFGLFDPTPQISWTPTKIDASHHTLLQYFRLVASSSVFCDVAPQSLLGTITRLSFHDSSTSSQAVLYASLAVSSLFRNGLSRETIRLHGKALRSLVQSTTVGISGPEVVHHVAAGLLLSAFEIHGNLQTSGPAWLLYLNGAKKLVGAVNLDQQVISNEFFETTCWLIHHDAFAMFSTKHWRRPEWKSKRTIRAASTPPDIATPDDTKAITAIACRLSEMTGTSPPGFMVLLPMMNIFRNIVDSSDPRYHTVAYRRELESLERSLESVLNGRHVSEANRTRFQTMKATRPYEATTLEIYRLAALIYLERASNSFSGTSAKVTEWSEAAFDLLKALGHCKYGFPMFIIGCEARTDEQRIIILDCLHETQGDKSIARTENVKNMIQSVWALDDLETEREVDYLSKIDVVISSCKTIPSLA